MGTFSRYNVVFTLEVADFEESSYKSVGGWVC